jgi:hypothetical protein
MNKAQVILMLALGLCTSLCTSIVSAQTDNGQQSVPPIPAYGQQNPAPAVNENPPISAIDQPGLEPHAAPESYLLVGAHFSESADSNVENQLGSSSVGFITRGLGSLTLQRLWKRYDLAMDYVGGVADYAHSSIGVQQLQQFDVDNRINWKRGQLALRDAFSYLPEGAFGGGGYGGLGLAGLGGGLVGAGAFGGQSNAFFGGSQISLGIAPRLNNLGLADVVEYLSPKSAITAAAGYGLVHFFGNALAEAGENISFLGSREYTGQVAYDRVLNSRNQAAISYGYQAFDFVDAKTQSHANVIQVMYGHSISGRMNFLISAGPQFIHISSVENLFGFLTLPVQANHIGFAGRMSIQYRFPKTQLSFLVQRYETTGSGLFAGAESNTARLEATRPLTRVWDFFADLGYAKDSRLQFATAVVNAGSYSYGFGGFGVHRYFGRSLRAYVSYQFNEAGFDSSCPVPGTSGSGCAHLSQRQVGTLGVDWTLRPIRLD